jgi:predicted nucleic acid-binding protein
VILFLDACAVIYLIESEASFHKTVVGALRGLRGRFPGARLAISRLSVLECLVKPMREGATELINEYRAFFAARDLLIVELDAQVVDLALTLRARDGLRTPDAVQAASTLSLRADGHRFLTNDRRFERVAALDVVDLGGGQEQRDLGTRR